MDSFVISDFIIDYTIKLIMVVHIYYIYVFLSSIPLLENHREDVVANTAHLNPQFTVSVNFPAQEEKNKRLTGGQVFYGVGPVFSYIHKSY